MQQLTHHQNRFTAKKFPVTVVCDTVTSPANVGTIFRTADAFGVENIIFCGAVPDFGKRMQKTSRSTEKYVPFEYKEDILDVVADLKNRGYTVCSVEITDTSIPLPEVPFKLHNKIALVIGAENYGVSEMVLNQSEYITHITMYGANSSMNVAQALTLALYECTKIFDVVK
ncbi:tRNA/rRNA methyltransferase [Neptunitalea chrysea]|uniref:tRNA/rRNA methyltransferase n=1 Tax=Neptunitalea chrysea TaxID=1647581 RepID=A0A9W6EUV0_9FLAO|nr:TrmH family RNA methyltransferase [Neptunitalea chrysea]GLB51772.1 tRNA/rRNA methyltransferase [Neptunitalea chrysea]